MRKSFLLRTGFLVLLCVLLIGLIVTLKSGFTAGSVGTDRTQTFFEQFVIAGGPIVWFVLLPMSLVTVYLTFEHSFTIRRRSLVPENVGRHITATIRRFGLRQLKAHLGNRNDLVSVAVLGAVSKGADDRFRIRSALAESLQDQASKLLRKIEWTSLIGNVSPMVGLFGTVFGMIKLFNAIVISGGQPQAAQLAEGISVALVTTFWGLFIAIPALAIYGVFRNRIESLVSEAVAEAENIMPEIRLGLKKQQQAETSRQKQLIHEIRGKSAEAVSRPLA